MRARLDEVVREDRDVYLRHPWLLQVAVSRPPLVRFPLANRGGIAVGNECDAPYDSEHAFEYGLARLLDGVSALIEKRSGPKG